MKNGLLTLLGSMICLFTQAQIDLDISQIQQTTNPNGASAFEGLEVNTEGIVTATAQENDLGAIYIQDQFDDEWAGIQLTGNPDLIDLVRGNRINVTGIVEEVSGETRINVSSVEVLQGAITIFPELIDPAIFSTYSLEAEKYEGMLIGFTDQPNPLFVTQANTDGGATNFGEWRVGFDTESPEVGCRVLTGNVSSQVNSSLWVSYINDLIWETNNGTLQVPAIVVEEGDEFQRIYGVMGQSFGDFKLLPRNNDDFKASLNDDFQGDDLVITTLSTRNTLSAGGELTSDDKILVSYTAESNTLSRHPAIARHNLDGSLDSDFDEDGVLIIETETNVSAIGIGETSQGQYLLGVTQVSGEFPELGLYRYNDDGTIDNNFGTNGLAVVPIPFSFAVVSEMIVQQDGKILFGGTDFEDLIFCRLNEDGSLDSDFGGNGFATVSLNDVPRLRDMKVHDDGKISGTVSQSLPLFQNQHVLIQLNPDGSLNDSFGNDGIRTLDLEETGRMVSLEPMGTDLFAAGYFEIQWGAPHVLAKLGSDGSLDESFGNSGYSSSTISDRGRETFTALKLLSSGNICAAGFDADTINVLGNQGQDLVLAIYSPNGELLGSKVVDLGFRTQITSIMEDQNGWIYVAGQTEGIDSFFGSGIIARFFPDEILSSYSVTGEKQRISAFPNPFQDVLTLKIDDNLLRIEEVSVFSSDGRLAKHYRGDRFSGSEARLSLSELPGGLYLISVETNQGREVVKVAK